MPKTCATETEREMLDLIEGLVRQGCIQQEDGEVDSCAIGIYAEALELLEDFGRVEIGHNMGRRVIARWTT